MHQRSRRSLLFAALLAVVAACSGDGATGTTRTAGVILNFLTPATVRVITVTVSGPGISPAVVRNIAVDADSTARDTVVLAAGAGRRFSFSAFDSTGIETHRADTTVNLVAGANASLAVRLMPLASSLGITVTFGGVRLSIGDTSTRSVMVGDTVRINASGMRGGTMAIPLDSLRWGSSNPAVAIVTGGLVSALRPGAAYVTVSSGGAAAAVRVSVPTPPSQLPTAGLLAWYRLNGDASDASGAGNDGATSGSSLAADRFGFGGRALAFDGTGGGVTSSSMLLNAGRSSFAISFWFRRPAFGCSGDGVAGLINSTPHAVLALGFVCSVAADRLSLSINDGVDGRWLLVDALGMRTDWQAGRWYNVILQKSGTRYQVFVDGLVDNDVELPAAAAFDVPFTLRFGGDVSTAWAYLNGDLDDLRVYGRSLTGEERVALANDRLFVATGIRSTMNPILESVLTDGVLDYTQTFYGDNGAEGASLGVDISSRSVGDTVFLSYWNAAEVAAQTMVATVRQVDALGNPIGGTEVSQTWTQGQKWNDGTGAIRQVIRSRAKRVEVRLSDNRVSATLSNASGWGIGEVRVTAVP